MDAGSLDIEHPNELLAYLRAAGRIGTDEDVHVRSLSGGVSNRAVWVQRPDSAGGEAWVLKQALAKLRVAVDWFARPERIEREALGLRWLLPLAPTGAITPLIWQDSAQHLLAMQAVPLPHENWKDMLLRGEVHAEHMTQFAALLAAIHGNASARHEELEPVFNDRSFFESLRIEPYYTYAAEQVPEAAAFLDALSADTRALRYTLVHGDYSPKNILVRNGRLILVDHEVIHWGDGAFDVGFALTHFLSKARHLPAQRKTFLNAALAFWSTYAAAVPLGSWVGHEARSVRHTLACMLARVAGRSPLEYLSAEDRAEQRAAVLQQMDRPPASMPELIAHIVA